MNYRFFIYHLESGKHPVEQAMFPLSEEAISREYSLFPSYLAHCCTPGSNIEFICTPRRYKGRNGLLLDLVSDQSEDTVKAYLERWLVNANQQITGLCMVADLTYDATP